MENKLLKIVFALILCCILVSLTTAQPYYMQKGCVAGEYEPCMGVSRRRRWRCYCPVGFTCDYFALEQKFLCVERENRADDYLYNKFF
ncbi:hypothetical protein HOLleu_22427 [Holothuria leucospilota]|uniref:Uncharacterized protein n=1 Tax=Holothuria leucospilota TaxID=206669 RepID=A0A9Q1H4M4_HOLLE|nr:hypothetical protein HOLleu_22427 [Holothuria leucospilota]